MAPGTGKRVALFATCFNDMMFPRHAEGGRAAAGAAGLHGRVPRGADLLRADVHQHRLLRRGGPGGPQTFVETFERVRLRRRRRRGPASARSATSTRCSPARRRRRAGRGASTTSSPRSTTSPSSWSTCSASPTSAPTSRTGSPTTRPATRCGCPGRRPAAADCCEAVRGIDLVELPDADQCCGFGGTFSLKNADDVGGDGRRQGPPRRDTGAEYLVAGDNSCLLHIGGVLRRGNAPASGPSTWPRSWPARADAGSVPAGDAWPPPCPATPALTPAPPSGDLLDSPRSPRRPSASSATRCSARTCATPPHTIRAKRARVVGELDNWEELRLAGEAIKDRVCATSTTYLEQFEANADRGRRHRALGPRRRGGQPRSSSTWSGATRRRARSSRSSRWPPRRSTSTRRSRTPASPPGRPTSPS